jgi:hypothetical protein
MIDELRQEQGLSVRSSLGRPTDGNHSISQ